MDALACEWFGDLHRRRLLDLLLTWRWKMTPQKSSPGRALELARLVDHRLRLAGIGRKAGTTLRRWSRQPVLAPLQDNLCRVADLADEAMYRRATQPHIDTLELEELARQLTYSELRTLTQSAAESPKRHAV